MYSLILSSNLPKAKEFKRWVTAEVLPSIRKTGSYSIIEQPAPMSTEHFLLCTAQVMVDHAERITAVETAMQKVQDIQEVQQSQIEHLVSKANKVPAEYPPVNKTIRKQLSDTAGGLALKRAKVTGKLIGTESKKIQADLIRLFLEDHDVDLVAEVRKAQDYYQFERALAKTRGTSLVSYLTPAEICKLSIYSVISTNNAYVQIFNQIVGDWFDEVNQQINSED